MKTPAQMREMIESLEERFREPNLRKSAYAALVARIDTLRWVLGEAESDLEPR